jgi:hypothetical protein
MQDEKTEAAATAAKSPAGDKPELTPFQKRFNESLEKWKAEGCQVILDEKTPTERFCGGKPHGVKIEPVNEAGNVVMAVACTERHERQWTFEVPEVEMKAELQRQKDAVAKAEADGGKERDPMKASVTITLDLRTQEVNIDPWVPTPGVGLQLGAIITAHFQHQLMSGLLMKRDPILTPTKGIINPKTGKPFVQ